MEKKIVDEKELKKLIKELITELKKELIKELKKYMENELKPIKNYFLNRKDFDTFHFL
jgi:hypothetical protein